MKKLTIILFSIFFTTSAQALIFKNCYFIEGVATEKKFDKNKMEKFEYQMFQDGTVRETKIPTDKFLKETNKKMRDLQKRENLNFSLEYEKIETRLFKITYSDEKFVKAVLQDDALIQKANFNLSDGTITYDNYVINIYNKQVKAPGSKLQCIVKKSKGSSNYLDYWWAVILIIAITFFIFTQSGKRLKKIRRK